MQVRIDEWGFFTVAVPYVLQTEVLTKLAGRTWKLPVGRLLGDFRSVWGPLKKEAFGSFVWSL